MSYLSIDSLQKTLSNSVFVHTKDAKKAAGRALGTLIEIITYYFLREWKIYPHIAIERALPEFGNPSITHNVEFTLHPIIQCEIRKIQYQGKLSAVKIAKEIALDESYKIKNNILIDSNNVIKNACVIAESSSIIVVAHLESYCDNNATIMLTYQKPAPFAMFECKRVGVEEGNKKGPQTIEKAKQGAYVAQMTSALQKIRNNAGEKIGLIYENGKPITGPYNELLRKIISDNEPLPKGFTMSIGLVSNHGNWFTSDDQNKELKVLSESYDWLLFLTDFGLAQFVSDLLLKPKKSYQVVQKAFLSSYQEGKKSNTFTKVRIDYDAHKALSQYFHDNIVAIEKWFNIISPINVTIENLKSDLNNLISKSNKRA